MPGEAALDTNIVNEFPKQGEIYRLVGPEIMMLAPSTPAELE